MPFTNGLFSNISVSDLFSFPIGKGVVVVGVIFELPFFKIPTISASPFGGSSKET